MAVSLGELGRGALLGTSSGMRSFSGAAALAWSGPAPGDRTGRPAASVRRTVLVLALGELAADKLPGVPARTSPGPLGLRVALGAFAAAHSARRRGVPAWPSALAGAAAAAAATRVFRDVRAWASSKVPDPLAALAEDALAYSLAAAAVRR